MVCYLLSMGNTTNSIRAPHEIYQVLRKLAARERRPIAQQLAVIVEEWLSWHPVETEVDRPAVTRAGRQ